MGEGTLITSAMRAGLSSPLPSDQLEKRGLHVKQEEPQTFSLHSLPKTSDHLPSLFHGTGECDSIGVLLCYHSAVTFSLVHRWFQHPQAKMCRMSTPWLLWLRWCLDLQPAKDI